MNTKVNNDMRLIDPHIHFFALAQGKYEWLKPQHPPYWSDKSDIAHPFDETNLIKASKGHIAGFVHIEAGFDNARPWREVHYLNRHCRLPFKSVAGINLMSPDVYGHIDYLASLPSVVGLRHILDSEAVHLLSHPKVKHVFAHMSQRGLLFEAQLDLYDACAVKALLRCLELVPSLKVIVNHSGVGGLNVSNSLGLTRWQSHIRALSSVGQIGIKVSGWEMQDRHWSWSAVTPVCEFLFEHVHHQNLMLASNYPLCQWRLSYYELWQGYRRLISHLPKSSQLGLFGENAARWYQFMR